MLFGPFPRKNCSSDENVKISNEQNLYQIWIFKIDEGKPKIEMSEVKNGQSM